MSEIMPWCDRGHPALRVIVGGECPACEMRDTNERLAIENAALRDKLHLVENELLTRAQKSEEKLAESEKWKEIAIADHKVTLGAFQKFRQDTYDHGAKAGLIRTALDARIEKLVDASGSAPHTTECATNALLRPSNAHLCICWKRDILEENK